MSSSIISLYLETFCIILHVCRLNTFRNKFLTQKPNDTFFYASIPWLLRIRSILLISKSIMLKVMIFFIFRFQSHRKRVSYNRNETCAATCIIHFGTCRDAKWFYFSSCIRNCTTWHILCLYCIKAILIFIIFIYTSNAVRLLFLRYNIAYQYYKYIVI